MLSLEKFGLKIKDPQILEVIEFILVVFACIYCFSFTTCLFMLIDITVYIICLYVIANYIINLFNKWKKK